LLGQLDATGREARRLRCDRRIRWPATAAGTPAAPVKDRQLDVVSSRDVGEVNPVLDRENQSGRLAVELIASALGARIL